MTTICDTDMHKVLPPLCLLMALASAITGFTLVSLPRPQPGVELHEATIGQNDQQREMLENRLRRDRRTRTYLISGLLTCSVVFTVAAFRSMRPAP